jgi:5-methyltetrahydropteroyltriglutamate--homocysteine methyltransferase
MAGNALKTTVVGSYPQPDWLVDRENLSHRLPPRVRAEELWRVPKQWLPQAQDDATLLAIRDMERAGIDIISDGEQRRESYSNRFATSLDGVDLESPGIALDRTGHPNPVPRVYGPIRRIAPREVEDVEFLRRNTDRQIKITLPGPFTMSQQAQDDYYNDEESLALAYAAAANEEVKALFAAGADVVQIDEPYMQARPEKAKQFGVKSLNLALEGVTGTTAVHLCFGYAHVVHDRPSGYSFLPELAESAAQQISIESAQSGLDLSVLRELSDKTIILGVLDLGDLKPETADVVARRVRNALNYVPPERLIPAPDCGMKYLPRNVAMAKLRALVEGTAIVNRELGLA